MSTLSRRGPNATTPAKLPGIQTSRIEDPNLRQALDALREWVEVRLGSRGDKWERAVTERRLEERLAEIKTTAASTDNSLTLNSLSERLTSVESAIQSFDNNAITQLRSRMTQVIATIAQLQAALDAAQDAIDALEEPIYVTLVQAVGSATGMSEAAADAPFGVAEAAGTSTATGVTPFGVAEASGGSTATGIS